MIVLNLEFYQEYIFQYSQNVSLIMSIQGYIINIWGDENIFYSDDDIIRILVGINIVIIPLDFDGKIRIINSLNNIMNLYLIGSFQLNYWVKVEIRFGIEM